MRLRWKGWLIIVTAVAVAIGVFSVVKSTMGHTATGYQLAAMTRGNLESTISATGTLAPSVTIEVGTQVSGTIDTVLVDFNDTVQAGQILAVLDTAVLRASVQESEANMERIEAALYQAEYNYNLSRELCGQGLQSESDSVATAVIYRSQLAELKSAKVALSKAKRNLDYAVVRSPIGGIVIEKSTESGQTVAASFSTPTLFVIANDLSRMEILAQVDESDIGEIKVGQQVRFEVATHSGKSFSGIVRQIRLQPETVSNVVTYTVVIEAPNDDGLLLPGMTATIDFITDTRTNVLLVPSKALKFQPSASEFEAAMAQRPRPPEAGDTTRISSGPAGGPQIPSDSAATQEMAVVWYLDAGDKLTPAPIRIGMSDGTNTEILDSRDLAEGRMIIVAGGDTPAVTKKTTSAFGGPGDPPPGGPGGM